MSGFDISLPIIHFIGGNQNKVLAGLEQHEIKASVTLETLVKFLTLTPIVS